MYRDHQSPQSPRIPWNDGHTYNSVEGRGLPAPIERLTLSIRVITRAGVDLGVALLSLAEPLGGTRADEYREGTFEGPNTWPLRDDGAPSPLCDEGVTLAVEGATGRQAGRVVDLVRFRQLTFATLPLLNVKVRE